MSNKFWDFGTQKSMSGQMVLFDWKAGVVDRGPDKTTPRSLSLVSKSLHRAFWELFAAKTTVSVTVEVGLYVRINRQIWQGGRYEFRTKMANFADSCPDKNGSDRRKISTDLYGHYPGSY